jgi:CheY-like chemotaxis protein
MIMLKSLMFPFFMHVLCVSNDPLLSRTRSGVLRLQYSVVESPSAAAWRLFVDGDFDAVVLCSSISDAEATALVRRIRQRSPSVVIVRCAPPGGCAIPSTVDAPKYDPGALIMAVATGSISHPGTHGRDISHDQSVTCSVS